MKWVKNCVLLDSEGSDQLYEVHLEACYWWHALKDQCRAVCMHPNPSSRSVMLFKQFCGCYQIVRGN